MIEDVLKRYEEATIGKDGKAHNTHRFNISSLAGASEAARLIDSAAMPAVVCKDKKGNDWTLEIDAFLVCNTVMLGLKIAKNGKHRNIWELKRELRGIETEDHEADYTLLSKRARGMIERIAAAADYEESFFVRVGVHAWYNKTVTSVVYHNKITDVYTEYGSSRNLMKLLKKYREKSDL